MSGEWGALRLQSVVEIGQKKSQLGRRHQAHQHHGGADQPQTKPRESSERCPSTVSFISHSPHVPPPRRRRPFPPGPQYWTSGGDDITFTSRQSRHLSPHDRYQHLERRRCIRQLRLPAHTTLSPGGFHGFHANLPIEPIPLPHRSSFTTAESSRSPT